MFGTGDIKKLAGNALAEQREIKQRLATLEALVREAVDSIPKDVSQSNVRVAKLEARIAKMRSVLISISHYDPQMEEEVKAMRRGVQQWKLCVELASNALNTDSLDAAG